MSLRTPVIRTWGARMKEDMSVEEVELKIHLRMKSFGLCEVSTQHPLPLLFAHCTMKVLPIRHRFDKLFKSRNSKYYK
jgi:hypothetical protein